MTNKTSTSALAEALARARSLAAEMGAATDELNESLEQAEKEIAALKLGVTASVVLEEPDEHTPFHALLRFGKEKQNWRLLYEWGLEGDAESDWESTPLVNASRAVRLDAVDHLPALVEALIAQASTEVEEIRSKTKAVRDLIASIKRTGDLFA